MLEIFCLQLLDVNVRNVYLGLVIKITGLIRKAESNWLATRYEGLGHSPRNYWDDIADVKNCQVVSQPSQFDGHGHGP